MNDIDESIQSLAHLESSEGFAESEPMDSHLAMFGQIVSDEIKYKDDEEYQRIKASKHRLHGEVVVAKGKLKHNEGLFTGMGSAFAVIAGLFLAWRVYHEFFSTAANERMLQNAFYVKLG